MPCRLRPRVIWRSEGARAAPTFPSSSLGPSVQAVPALSFHPLAIARASYSVPPIACPGKTPPALLLHLIPSALRSSDQDIFRALSPLRSIQEPLGEPGLGGSCRREPALCRDDPDRSRLEAT